jgi:hypothetical protein
MADELDEYEDDVEREQDTIDGFADDQALADADELFDGTAEADETPFDETRHQYSGVVEGDADVDVEEYEEAGALFDDPEKTVLMEGGVDDPDGSDGWR